MSGRPRKRGRRSSSGQGGQRAPKPSVNKEELQAKTVAELKEIATGLELDVKALKKREDLVEAVYRSSSKIMKNEISD